MDYSVCNHLVIVYIMVGTDLVFDGPVGKVFMGQVAFALRPVGVGQVERVGQDIPGRGEMC